MIENEEVDASPELEEALETNAVELSEESNSQSSPWKAFILTGLIASLFGAAAGGYGVYAAVKAKAPNPIEATKLDLSPLETQMSRLTSRLEAAEASVEKVVNQPVPKSIPADVSGLEKRLEALESAPSPEINPAALRALKSAQKDGFEWPDTSDLEDRLSALETREGAAPELSLPADLLDRLETLEAEVQTGESGVGNSDVITALETRLTALETRPAKGVPVQTVPILAFPKAAMVTAVKENIEGGVFKKTLSRHVRVKDENDPLTLIEGIEADIAKGRLEGAVKKYDRLPEPIRAAGQAWYDSVKASL